MPSRTREKSGDTESFHQSFRLGTRPPSWIASPQERSCRGDIILCCVLAEIFQRGKSWRNLLDFIEKQKGIRRLDSCSEQSIEISDDVRRVMSPRKNICYSCVFVAVEDIQVLELVPAEFLYQPCLSCLPGALEDKRIPVFALLPCQQILIELSLHEANTLVKTLKYNNKIDDLFFNGTQILTNMGLKHIFYGHGKFCARRIRPTWWAGCPLLFWRSYGVLLSDEDFRVVRLHAGDLSGFLFCPCLLLPECGR